jgi:uncharacterized protein (DUF983 family)
MIKKGTKMYSILRSKCPHCQEGDFFKYKGFKGIGEVPDKCSACGERFHLEPGFYFGAMYFSYGMGVLLLIVIWTAFSVFSPDSSALTIVASIAVALMLLGWKIYKLSRVIWANMFFQYKEDQ